MRRAAFALAATLAGCAGAPAPATAEATSELVDPSEPETRRERRGVGTALPGPGLEDLDAEGATALLRSPEARLYLVNAWATWCQPCVEELPDVLAVAREVEARGVRLVLISGDFGSARPEVEGFLAERGITFRTYLKRGEDGPFIDAIHPAWSGALPATVLINPRTGARTLHEGKLDAETLRGLVNAALAEAE